MASWAASCAVAPDRRCLLASWCVTQIYTPPPLSTCCTTPSIIFSWLLQCWSVLSEKKSVYFHCSSRQSLFILLSLIILSDAPRGVVSKHCWIWSERVQPCYQLKLRLHYYHDEILKLYRIFILNYRVTELNYSHFFFLSGVLMQVPEMRQKRTWRCLREIF